MNSRIEIAQERLERALQRIDAALLRGSAPGTDLPDRDALATENAELRRQNAEIGERLDRAIDRLRSILNR